MHAQKPSFDHVVMNLGGMASEVNVSLLWKNTILVCLKSVTVTYLYETSPLHSL